MRLKCSYDLIKPDIIIRSLNVPARPRRRKNTISIQVPQPEKKTEARVSRGGYAPNAGLSRFVSDRYTTPRSSTPWRVAPYNRFPNGVISDLARVGRPTRGNQKDGDQRRSPRVEVFHDIITQRLPHPILPPVEVHINEGCLSLLLVQSLFLRLNGRLVQRGLNESRH